MNGDLVIIPGGMTKNIVSGFKKCCISNAMDGSEDGVLWEAEQGMPNQKVSGESGDSEVDSDAERCSSMRRRL
ncbi:hypothetical protein AAFF_G00132120 [Aldrovandia affinis]|uniref:Uncharacterized protein n=1 Tax=Aldrovandia affinis TaxID=143900 RepID=A0AAD7R0X1_9TELE|nr:hypothetical protein AAFF_G00132120 [Aldrovandia affinis]